MVIFNVEILRLVIESNMVLTPNISRPHIRFDLKNHFTCFIKPITIIPNMYGNCLTNTKNQRIRVEVLIS